MSTNFFGVQYDVIDELTLGTGVKMRLVENIKTKRRAIQSWGSLSGEWIVTQRYGDVQSAWDKTVKIINGLRK